jgi:excisionase family DNA binding protein
VTADEAAVRLGCKPSLIYKLCAHGRLGHLRVGFGRGRVVIEERHLDEYRRRGYAAAGRCSRSRLIA